MRMMHARAGSASMLVMALSFAAHNAAGNLAVVSASDIQRTGNLVPRQKAAIQLDYENLAVRLDAETATVAVKYEFRNYGDNDDVTVGFPIDVMPASSEAKGYNVDHWQDESLTDFQILDGANQLPVEQTIEEQLPSQNRPQVGEDVSTKRRWLISKLHFKRGEHKTVHVNYKVRCMGVDQGFEGETKSSKFTPRTFLYSLRPATTWGNGRVQKIDVAIDKGFLERNRLNIIKTDPKPQIDDSLVMRWSFNNLDLSDAPDFVCVYDSTPALFESRAPSLFIKNAENLRLKLSNGDTAKRNIAALFDRNLSTAWLLNPKIKGIGSSIEFRPRKDTYVSEVAILNGCFANAQEYANYARIKRLRIETLVRSEEGPKREISEMVLPDHRFDDRALRFPTYYADYVISSAGPEGILEYAKLTVLDIYPGTESRSPAISELYMYGRDLHGR
jgi:hypothetical protein